MMGLESHFEVVKLARELQAGPDALEGLDVLAPADVRRLRTLAGRSLHDEHRVAYQRAAAASALLPAPLTARLAQTVIGPHLSARIAGEMPTGRSIRLASHLDVPFLAEVCLSLDPGRVADTVRGLDDEQVIAVGLELLARAEYVTLGKFVDVVRPAVVDAVVDQLDDPVALLHIAMAVEARHRLDEVVARVDDARLVALMRAAATEDEMAGAITLVSHLGHDNRGRVVRCAIEAGPEVLDAVVRTAHDEDAWPLVLSLLAAVDPDELPPAVNVPATVDPAVLRSVIEAAEAADLWDDLLPLVVALDEPRIRRLAEMDDLLTADRIARLVSAALPRAPLWGALVDTVGRIPEPQQVRLADRLLADDAFDVPALLGLLTLVPASADLPLVTRLQQAGA